MRSPDIKLQPSPGVVQELQQQLHFGLGPSHSIQVTQQCKGLPGMVQELQEQLHLGLGLLLLHGLLLLPQAGEQAIDLWQAQLGVLLLQVLLYLLCERLLLAPLSSRCPQRYLQVQVQHTLSLAGSAGCLSAASFPLSALQEAYSRASQQRPPAALSACRLLCQLHEQVLAEVGMLLPTLLATGRGAMAAQHLGLRLSMCLGNM